MKDQWDYVARSWNDHMRNGDWFQKNIIYPTVINMIENLPHQKIIDVGCGNGHLSRYLHSFGAISYGIDKSEAMIELCKKESSDIGFETCDVTKQLPREKDFDYAIFNNSLQDMDNFSEGLKNTHSILKPNGHVLIIVKHPCFHPAEARLGWKLTSADGDEITSGCGLANIAHLTSACSAEYFMMDNYFSAQKHERIWYGNKTTSFARTVEIYFNTLVDVGYSVKRIYEPRPIQAGQSGNELLYELLNRIPNFIVFLAQKENLK